MGRHPRLVKQEHESGDVTSMVRPVSQTLVTPMFPEPLVRPETGFDIFEERPDLLLNKLPGRRENWPITSSARPIMRSGCSTKKTSRESKQPVKKMSVLDQAILAYVRARNLFGDLPAFKRNNARPPHFHFSEKQVQAFSLFMNTDLPSVWFIPELLYAKDMVGFGLNDGWWKRDKDMSHIPTVDPYNHGSDAHFQGVMHHENDDVVEGQGGIWVLWQPILLPLSNIASLQEQERMIKRLVHAVHVDQELSASLGFIADQAVLWTQALASGLINNRQILFARSCTPIRYELFHGSQFKASDTNLSIGFKRGHLEIADYGNQIAKPWIGISPYIY